MYNRCSCLDYGIPKYCPVFTRDHLVQMMIHGLLRIELSLHYNDCYQVKNLYIIDRQTNALLFYMIAIP